MPIPDKALPLLLAACFGLACCDGATGPGSEPPEQITAMDGGADGAATSSCRLREATTCNPTATDPRLCCAGGRRCADVVGQTRCCNPPGGECASDDGCCGRDVCREGRCCAPVGQACDSASDCCDGMACADHRCVRACTPSCADNQVCGDDGCGGACGAGCPASQPACAADGAACRACDLYTQQSYTLDASAINWRGVNSVSVTVRQVLSTGALSDALREAVLTANTTSAPAVVTFGAEPPGNACAAAIEITRHYSLFGGRSCDAGPERVTGRTRLVLPDPTQTPDGCTAPAL